MSKDKKFQMDCFRYFSDSTRSVKRLISSLHDKELHAIKLGRKAVLTKNKYLKRFYQWKSRKLFGKHFNEIVLDNIGGGIRLVHPYSITINRGAVIGEMFTIFKGATVGSIRHGEKRGTPTIGDRVTVCANAMVCGNITIGDDVLISANAFVNFDVPSNSVVIGNPGVIYNATDPSKDYLPNRGK